LFLKLINQRSGEGNSCGLFEKIKNEKRIKLFSGVAPEG
jgi:hypothetical protein